jgi:hypothetical protein
VLTLIAALIAAGAVLAGFGTAGFCAITAPHNDDLTITRIFATTGRRCIATGVLLLLATHPHLAAIGTLAVIAAICMARLSLITKTTRPHTATA